MFHSTKKISKLGLGALFGFASLVLVLSVSATASASPAGNAFVGVFKGDGVILSLKKGQKNLSGTLKVKGVSYRTVARADGGSLRGTFRSGDDKFPFTAKRDGRDVVLRSGGTAFRLQSAPHAAKNPLAMSAASGSRAKRGRPQQRARRLQIVKRVFQAAANVAVAAAKSSSNGKSGRAASAGKSSGPWPSQLVGKRWYEFHHYSGMSEKTVYTFCPGGRLVRSGGMSASDSTSGFSMARQSGDAGSWAVSGPQSQGTLRLSYQGGSVEEKTLEYDGNTLMVDGNKWLSERAQCQ
jgi:hypothetical protein